MFNKGEICKLYYISKTRVCNYLKMPFTKKEKKTFEMVNCSCSVTYKKQYANFHGPSSSFIE